MANARITELLELNLAEPSATELDLNSLDLPQLFLKSLQRNAQNSPVGTSGPTTYDFLTIDQGIDQLCFQSPEASYALKPARELFCKEEHQSYLQHDMYFQRIDWSIYLSL